MKRSFLYLVIGALSLSAFYSCEELENLCNIQESDLKTGDVFVKSLNTMIDIYKRVDEANKNAIVLSGGEDKIDGASCKIEGDSLFIDFGIGDVVCADGKLRRGSIRVRLLNDYLLPAGEANAILSNYFVDGTQISGQFDARNDGPAASPVYNISTTEFNVGDESTVDYTFDASWGQGFETSDPTDDIFDVSGIVTGEDKENAKDFTADVIQPLHYVTACPDYIEKGILDIQLVGDTTVSGFIVDFIDSDGCNNLFQVSVDCEGSPISFTYPMN